MKKSPSIPQGTYFVLCLAYIILCLAAVFYMNAYFWTYATRLCGNVWMYLTVFLCTARMLHLIHPCKLYKVSFLLCTVLISCIQIPVIGAWLILSDGRHTYYWPSGTVRSSATLITPWGALFHAVIFLMSAAILYYHLKPFPKSNQPQDKRPAAG